MEDSPLNFEEEKRLRVKMNKKVFIHLLLVFFFSDFKSKDYSHEWLL